MMGKEMGIVRGGLKNEKDKKGALKEKEKVGGEKRMTKVR